jgi:hypothetical protein
MFRQPRLIRRLGSTLLVAVLCLTTGAVLSATLRTQALVEVGYRDFSFSAIGISAPTGQKPQSKLWFNDGLWWGSLFSVSADAYHIYRFNWASHTWTDTGTLVDVRNNALMDCLWDGSRLYTLSAGPTATAANSARLMRYSYSAATKTYTVDAGFPVTITPSGMETIVIAKDTTGILWAAYTTTNQVYVTHSTGSDLVWVTPYLLPVAGADNLTVDDIAAVVSFGSKIGVFWSNQASWIDYFAVHVDGAPDTTWTSEIALSGFKNVDDHFNLKVDPTGRVMVAAKTSQNDGGGGGPNAPLVVLLVRDLLGHWTNTPVWRVTENVTRSVLLLDEQNGTIYLFSAAPCCYGGDVYFKLSSLSSIAFPTGMGTPFLHLLTDATINNPTSTKQNLNNTTGLLVLASDYFSGYYMHNILNLGGSPSSGCVPLNDAAGTILCSQ